ncbi:MAG: TolC family protein [Epsilonproteobacteria bacterium]|nr:TolC family protein [Campylobacterota bacterium]
MVRAALLTLTTISFSLANWCIYHSLQQKIHSDEDKVFLKNFPKGSITKVNGLYRFKSGPYETKEEAIEWLNKAKEFNSDAYMKRCKKKLKKTQAPRPLPKLKTLIPKKTVKKTSLPIHNNNNYTLLDFYTYMEKLFKSDYGLKESNYKEILTKVEALLENSRYDWNIFGNALTRYSKFINYDLGTNKELAVDLGIGANKRVFDPGMLVKERLLELKKRLGKLEGLSAKDKLSLYGVSIYTQALFNQKVKELYEEIYLAQKGFFEIVKERNRAGLASKVDLIDAKNDLLELKKTVLLKMYEYLYFDFLLRNSANITDPKPLKLKEFKIKSDGGELIKIFNQILHDNLLIQQERTLFSIKKASLEQYKKSYLPIVDFSSSLYYEYKKDFGLDPAKSTNGLNYQAMLNLKFPIYSAENRGYLLEKAKLETLMQKYKLLNTIKETSSQAFKYLNEIERLKKHLLITKEQVSLMKEKLELVKKRYINGLSNYRQYSDAIRNYLTLLEEKKQIETSLIQNEATLEVLKGKRVFYGKD